MMANSKISKKETIFFDWLVLAAIYSFLTLHLGAAMSLQWTQFKPHTTADFYHYRHFNSRSVIHSLDEENTGHRQEPIIEPGQSKSFRSRSDDVRRWPEEHWHQPVHRANHGTIYTSEHGTTPTGRGSFLKINHNTATAWPGQLQAPSGAIHYSQEPFNAAFSPATSTQRSSTSLAHRRPTLQEQTRATGQLVQMTQKTPAESDYEEEEEEEEEEDEDEDIETSTDASSSMSTTLQSASSHGEPGKPHSNFSTTQNPHGYQLKNFNDTNKKMNVSLNILEKTHELETFVFNTKNSETQNNNDLQYANANGKHNQALYVSQTRNPPNLKSQHSVDRAQQEPYVSYTNSSKHTIPPDTDFYEDENNTTLGEHYYDYEDPTGETNEGVNNEEDDLNLSNREPTAAIDNKQSAISDIMLKKTNNTSQPLEGNETYDENNAVLAHQKSNKSVHAANDPDATRFLEASKTSFHNQGFETDQTFKEIKDNSTNFTAMNETESETPTYFTDLEEEPDSTEARYDDDMVTSKISHTENLKESVLLDETYSEPSDTTTEANLEIEKTADKHATSEKYDTTTEYTLEEPYLIAGNPQTVLPTENQRKRSGNDNKPVTRIPFSTDKKSTANAFKKSENVSALNLSSSRLNNDSDTIKATNVDSHQFADNSKTAGGNIKTVDTYVIEANFTGNLNEKKEIVLEAIATNLSTPQTTSESLYGKLAADTLLQAIENTASENPINNNVTTSKPNLETRIDLEKTRNITAVGKNDFRLPNYEQNSETTEASLSRVKNTTTKTKNAERTNQLVTVNPNMFYSVTFVTTDPTVRTSFKANISVTEDNAFATEATSIKSPHTLSSKESHREFKLGIETLFKSGLEISHTTLNKPDRPTERTPKMIEVTSRKAGPTKNSPHTVPLDRIHKVRITTVTAATAPINRTIAPNTEELQEQAPQPQKTKRIPSVFSEDEVLVNNILRFPWSTTNNESLPSQDLKTNATIQSPTDATITIAASADQTDATMVKLQSPALKTDLIGDSTGANNQPMEALNRSRVSDVAASPASSTDENTTSTNNDTKLNRDFNFKSENRSVNGRNSNNTSVRENLFARKTPPTLIPARATSTRPQKKFNLFASLTNTAQHSTALSRRRNFNASERRPELRPLAPWQPSIEPPQEIDGTTAQTEASNHSQLRLNDAKHQATHRLSESQSESPRNESSARHYGYANTPQPSPTPQPPPPPPIPPDEDGEPDDNDLLLKDTPPTPRNARQPISNRARTTLFLSAGLVVGAAIFFATLLAVCRRRARNARLLRRRAIDAFIHDAASEASSNYGYSGSAYSYGGRRGLLGRI